MESWNNNTVDLRVDDSPEPLKELRRLYTIQLAYDHMSSGDLAYEKMHDSNLATEKSDINTAMTEYNAAMKLFPENLEMQYWTAITLANNKQLNKALPMLKTVFTKDRNWKELTKRLQPAGLLTISDDDLKKILSL